MNFPKFYFLKNDNPVSVPLNNPKSFDGLEDYFYTYDVVCDLHNESKILAYNVFPKNATSFHRNYRIHFDKNPKKHNPAGSGTDYVLARWRRNGDLVKANFSTFKLHKSFSTRPRITAKGRSHKLQAIH